MSKRKDTHTYVLRSHTLSRDLTLDGTKDAETIKGSDLVDSGAVGFDIIGGYEDCIDCVRGTNYLFANGRMRTSEKTRTFITLKGGIDTIVLRDLLLVGSCKYPWHISLGDHTIYNNGGLMNQRNIVIDNVNRPNGKKVWIFCLDSQRPRVYRGNYGVIKVPKFLAKIWLKILN